MNTLLAITLSATAALAQGQKASAITAEQVEHLLKTAPRDYNTHLTAGKFYQDKGIVGQAQDEFRQAIACKGASPEAYKYLAQLLLKSSDRAEAEKVAKEGVKLFPNDYGMLLTAGYILHNQSKLAEAQQMYEAAARVNPNNGEIYVALADVSSAMNQPQKALQYINKAIALSHSKPSDLLCYEQAKVLVMLGRFEEAKKPLAENFSRDPLNFKNNKLYLTVLNSQKLAREALKVQLCIMVPANKKQMDLAKADIKEMLMTMKEPDAVSAISNAEAAIKDIKLKGRLHFALGDIYDRMNKPEQAIAHYQSGLRFDPTLARGYLRLGEDLETYKKDLPAALKNYEKAYSLDKNDPEIQLHLQRLKARGK
ncbi:MAG: tetratricopeptide repeat protein [Cyanobacteria bacterium SZAS TMP-1]|nr:tetratricopeptide repeat protein [Cyanobacteria bacterium SZAS TMP-1]